MAVLQMLSGYRENLLASGDQDAIDKADFFVRLMRDSIVDPAGGALGVTMEGAWDRAATLPPGEMAAAAADALPEGPPRGSYSSAENEDYFYALLAPDPPQMHVRSHLSVRVGSRRACCIMMRLGCCMATGANEQPCHSTHLRCFLSLSLRLCAARLGDTGDACTWSRASRANATAG